MARPPAGAAPDNPVFPTPAGTYWRETDWRNWRKRVFVPAAHAVGLEITRPYDLGHSFVSLRLHEGALSIVEQAEQMGHNPTVCLSTYAHVMADLRGAPKTSAEEAIHAARASAFRQGPAPSSGPAAFP